VTWAKLDDQFHDHPKVESCSFAARGLWATALSWCVDRLTDGFVPNAWLRTHEAPQELADELVSAGLWEPTGKGYQFHDWADYQPMKADVMVKRAADRDRHKRSYRHKRTAPPDPGDSSENSPRGENTELQYESARRSRGEIADLRADSENSPRRFPGTGTGDLLNSSHPAEDLRSNPSCSPASSHPVAGEQACDETSAGEPLDPAPENRSLCLVVDRTAPVESADERSGRRGRQRLLDASAFALDFSHAGQWRPHLIEIGNVSDAEWPAIAAIIQRELNSGRKSRLTPKSIADRLHVYRQGRSPGDPIERASHEAKPPASARGRKWNPGGVSSREEHLADEAVAF